MEEFQWKSPILDVPNKKSNPRGPSRETIQLQLKTGMRIPHVPWDEGAAVFVGEAAPAVLGCEFPNAKLFQRGILSKSMGIREDPLFPPIPISPPIFFSASPEGNSLDCKLGLFRTILCISCLSRWLPSSNPISAHRRHSALPAAFLVR